MSLLTTARTRVNRAYLAILVTATATVANTTVTLIILLTGK